MKVLEVRDVSVHFGGLRAVDEVSLSVADGEIVGLIGPNGAGKTTMFNCLSGLQRPTSGSVLHRGHDLTHLPLYSRAHRGIGRTFQQVQLFGKVSARDNVLIGIEAASGSLGIMGSLLRGPGARRLERARTRRAEALLDFVGAGDIVDRLGKDLPLGLARRVELAGALGGANDVLLLDEPASGLDADEASDFGDLILKVRDELGITVFIVEHDVPLVSRICDKLYVLDFGSLLTNGHPRDVLSDPLVIAAYLGEEVSL